MKKILSIIVTLAMVITTLAVSFANASADQSISKLVAFGDSVIAGLCMKGPDKNSDAYGDQKATDLLGKEYGLTRYTSADKIKSDNAEKWFYNSSVSGYTTGQIYEKEVLGFDKELLAQADLVYMNGGTNDACATMSKFLGDCSWGATCGEWTLDETKKYIEDNSAQMSKIAAMIKDNFVKIITYLANLDGFDGKIIIQNYPNQYAGNKNTNGEYFWDEFYERAVTSGQRAAIEETKDIYSNVELLDVTSKLRDGAKYTNVNYGDAQHLTFAGNREIYKLLSLMLNPEGTNLLTFESTDIPENAVWRNAYDFENYELGTTSISGVSNNNVSVVDISETYDSDGTAKTGTNTASKKVLKCDDTNSANQTRFNLSAYTQNAYGIRLRFTYPAGNSKMKYFELHTTDGQSMIRVLPINSSEWGQSVFQVGSSMYKSWYSTMINISDIQKVDYFKIWGDVGNSCYYIDDIEILTTDETLPEIPDVTIVSSKTTTTTQKTSTTTTTTKTTSSGSETKLVFNSDTFDFTDNTAGFAFSESDGIPNIFGKISANTGVTMTSKVQVEAGVYDLTVYARSRAVRPAFDIEVNGTVVGKSIDTSNTVLGTNNDAPASLSSITIPEATYVTIKIIGSEGISAGWLYLNSLKFTKTSDIPTASSSTTTTTQKETTTTTTSTTTTTTKQSAIGTENEMLFSEDVFDLSDNTANLAFGTSYEGYKMISGTISEGKGVTMTSKVQLEPGVYDTTLYARARGARPLVDIEVNGTVIGSSVDTSNTALGTNNNAPVSLSSITIPKTTYVTIKITGSVGISSGLIYLNSLKFTKTADYSSEDTSLEVKSTMESGAAIRLGEVNGIRFYTTVDTAKIAELKADGATVEMGTLIAPKDLLGNDELTFNLDAGKYVDVAYKANEYYTEGNFTGIVGSIVNIKESNTAFSAENGNIAREFVGRGYVKVTKDGTTTITYADYSDSNIANNSRSVAYVSYKLVQDTEIFNQYSKDIQEKVKKWAGLYQN